MMSWEFNDEQKLGIRSNFLDFLDNDILQASRLFFEYLSLFISLLISFRLISSSSNIVKGIE